MIDRRMFLVGLATVASASLGAEAQPTRKNAKVGILAPSAGPLPMNEVFVQALQKLGWVKDQNLLMETRYMAGREAAAAPLLGELVGLGPDVLVVWATAAALAAKQGAGQIPVVFVATGDPLRLGLAANLAHPGGNMTGIAAVAEQEEYAKRLGLLKEVLPSIARVAVLVTSDGRALMEASRQTMMTAAQALKLELQEIHVETPGELPAAIRKAKAQGAQALYVWPSGLTFVVGKQLAELALANHLPSVHPFAESAGAGGLLSYSASLTEIARRAAWYVDKILRGARPGDLPIEQPTTFELVVNLRTARALCLTIPASVLLRADQVIE
jgi:putative tryptophan/tyrosine transport system substrate-binding protein